MQFPACGLRGLEILGQRAADDGDLLLELFRINFLLRAQRFDLGMVFTQPGIEQQRLLCDGVLIIGQNFLNRRILNVERGHHPHEIFALELFNLLELGGESGDLGFRVVHFAFLFHHDVVDRSLRVFGSFGI